MADLTAQRTLVKSPPELWSELSEVESLARHLGELGEIRITKVEPETTVAWEGEQISGTVQLEQSGWGTKVTFHATVPEPDLTAEPEPLIVEPEPVAPEPEPVAVEPKPVTVELEPALPPEPPKESWLRAWLFKRRRPSGPEPVAFAPEPATIEFEAEAEPVAIEPDPTPVVEPDPAPTPIASIDAERVQQVLDGTLDALGQAHHRPFSRG